MTLFQAFDWVLPFSLSHHIHSYESSNGCGFQFCSRFVWNDRESWFEYDSFRSLKMPGFTAQHARDSQIKWLEYISLFFGLLLIIRLGSSGTSHQLLAWAVFPSKFLFLFMECPPRFCLSVLKLMHLKTLHSFKWFMKMEIM